ncbi:MAG TPA: hypothetical protein VNZ52_11095 [Candidatus Thermoplasmatota archaeon]|nr:hypothetical protein [Candidatus Thermoplasmatota archaeon]
MTPADLSAKDPHAGHGDTQPALKRWAGLEGWWIVAGIIALLVLLALRAAWFA